MSYNGSNMYISFNLVYCSCFVVATVASSQVLAALNFTGWLLERFPVSLRITTAAWSESLAFHDQWGFVSFHSLHKSNRAQLFWDKHDHAKLNKAPEPHPTLLPSRIDLGNSCLMSLMGLYNLEWGDLAPTKSKKCSHFYLHDTHHYLLRFQDFLVVPLS